jgi:hypothetical protein
MSDTQAEASEAGRSLVRARWGNSVVRSAVATLRERSGELDEALKAELRQIAGDPADGDDAA